MGSRVAQTKDSTTESPDPLTIFRFTNGNLALPELFQGSITLTNDSKRLKMLKGSDGSVGQNECLKKTLTNPVSAVKYMQMASAFW